jgi:hypothetical protein
MINDSYARARMPRSTASHRARAIGRCVLLALALPARSGGAQSGSPVTSNHATAFRCLDTAFAAIQARLDARHAIFVEQQTVAVQHDGRVLVAGNPVFVWRDRGDGYDRVAVDSVFGMVVDPTAVVRAIPSPLPGRVLDGMRAVALPDGWWLTTFAEVVPADLPKRPVVVAMWSAETDGARWRRLRALPVVVDSMDVLRASKLVWRDGRARLALPPMRTQRRQFVLYSLDDGRWRATIHDLGLVSYIAPALTPTRDLLAVVRTIEDQVADMNSLFLYAKGPGDTTWRERELIVRAGLEPVHEPNFVFDGRHVLSWRRSRRGVQGWDAWVTVFDEAAQRTTPPMRLTSGFIEYTVAARDGHVVWAASDRAWPDPVLQLVESDASSRIARLQRTTRYRGLLGLAITRDRAVVVAAHSAASSREPGVVSMVETHTWRCR